MKVLDPGHDFSLDNLDDIGKTRLVFVKRMGEGYPGNESAYPGTNMQEVLRVLINRCEYVNKQKPCDETVSTINHLRQALMHLEIRAARRHGRILDFTAWWGIEHRPYCEKCGHISCGGECH